MARGMSRRLLLLLVVALLLLTVQPAKADPYEGAPGARSQTVGAELFLGGNYIELGISAWGDFGTEGNKPANFYGTAVRNSLGMSADHDGFNYGHDLRVDYYLPGTPEERFAVGYEVGASTYANSNSARMGAKNMATTATNQSSGDILKATVVSTWAGTMEITQVISFTVDQKFFRNEVTIKNISSTSWDGARYMRTMDPDNTVDIGGQYVTNNTVTHTVAEDGKAVVKAETYRDDDAIYSVFGSRAPIFYYSTDPAAVASVFGFSNSNPYAAAAYDSPRPKNETVQQDVAITMTWDSGALAPEETKSFTYYTSLDERDFEEVEGEIGCSSVSTATNTGTATFCTDQGTVASLAAVPESTLPTAGKPSLQFPHGFFEFEITGLTPSQSVTLTITLPSAVPMGSQYWKYGPTPPDPSPHWYQIPMGSNDGDNVITITLTDGAAGDDDLTPNGIIVDQGGPGWPPQMRPSPVFPNLYVGIAAALGAFVMGYVVRRRLLAK
jgi:hypothetical protein